jgi:hypothetical protein
MKTVTREQATSHRSWWLWPLLGTLACGEASHSAAGPIGASAGGQQASGGNLPSGGAGNETTGGASGGTPAASGGVSQATPGGSGGGEASGVVDCFGAAIDIRTALVSGSIKVNGATSGTDYGTLSLSRGSDSVALGKTTSASFSVRVIPGTYDVTFRSKAGGSATVKSGIIVSSPQTGAIDIDVPTGMLNIAPDQPPDPSDGVTLEGNLTVNGQPLGTDVGSITLLARGVHFQRSLSMVSPSGFSGRVPPDTYDIEVASQPTPPLLGLPTTGQVLAHGVVVGASGTTTHDIDVRLSSISGTITFAGSTPGMSNLLLSSATAGQVRLTPDASGAYSLPIVPSTYDLVYSSSNSDGPLRNSWAILKSGLVVSESGPNQVDADVPSATVSGRLSLVGQAVTDMNEDGMLVLRGGSRDQISLGNVSSGSYLLRLVPGSYDLYFQAKNPAVAQVAPLNTRGKVETVVLGAGQATLDIDLRPVEISGSVTIDGSLVDKESDGGRLWLKDGQGDSVALGWTSTGKYSARVLPGTYDVVYAGTSPSSRAPYNTEAKLGCLTVPQAP